MLPFRQILSTFSVVVFVLHAHQQLHGSGQALARPFPNSADESFEVFATLPRATVPESDTESNSQYKITPEAVIKALQSLANGVKNQQDGKAASPVVAISHGEGGPIKPEAISDNDDEGAAVKYKNNQDSDAAKAAMQNLQQPRTRFCAQAANVNSTIDDISQTLVKKERKRLAAIRKQRISKTGSNGNATDARSLTDARLLAEQTKTVQVVWHVIHSGSAGNVSNTMISDQIATLNADYKPYGFSFDLNTTNRVDNANWFKKIRS